MGLKVSNVSKSYGTKKVVDNVNIELNKPGVFGLLGTNGARKNYNNKNDIRYLKKR